VQIRKSKFKCQNINFKRKFFSLKTQILRVIYKEFIENVLISKSGSIFAIQVQDPVEFESISCKTDQGSQSGFCRTDPASGSIYCRTDPGSRSIFT